MHYWENYFTLKIALFLKVFLFPLSNCLFLKTALHCVTLKNCVTWKLYYFEKLRYLKTVLLWKAALLENCVTFEKFCVGVRYFWRLLIDNYLRYLVKKRCCLIIIFLKLRLLKTDLVITVSIFETVLQWKLNYFKRKFCIEVRYCKILCWGALL